MPSLSIIEFCVYGLIAYSGILMMIISTIKEVPSSKSGSIYRVIWLTPCAIVCLFLAFGVTDITMQNSTSVITNLNTTEVYTEDTNNIIFLENPIWVTFHFMLFIILVIYIILQALNLLTKLE